jgi:hypothetical protein
LKLIKKFILAVVLGCSYTAFAHEQLSENNTETSDGSAIKLLAYSIPAILESSGKGKYDQLFQLVKHQAKRSWQYQVMPPARVDKMFEYHKADCIFPFDKAFQTDQTTISSDYFTVAQAYIFSAEGSKPFTSLTQLLGKRVGVRNGMLYGPEYEKLGLKVNLVDSIEQNLEKLQSGRIDAFLAWAPDVMAFFAEKQMKPLPHAAPFVLHHDAFLCHGTEKSRQFIKEFDQALVKLKQQGVVDKLLK